MLKYYDTVDAVELVFSNVQELTAYAESYRGALNDGYKSWDGEFIAEIKTVADAEKVFDLLEIERVEEKVELDYGIKGHVKPSNLMGYELMMESDYRKDKQYVSFKFSINSYAAIKENKFAPTIGVNYNPFKGDSRQEYFVEIQTTSYGALGFDDYEKFMLATQKAFVVAKEFEGEIADFVKYQEEYFGVSNDS